MHAVLHVNFDAWLYGQRDKMNIELCIHDIKHIIFSVFEEAITCPDKEVITTALFGREVGHLQALYTKYLWLDIEFWKALASFHFS